MKKQTIKEKIVNELFKLNIGDSIDKKEFIEQIYGYYDYFVSRSFDVHLCKAKQEMKDIMIIKSNTDFLITRIK